MIAPMNKNKLHLYVKMRQHKDNVNYYNNLYPIDQNNEELLENSETILSSQQQYQQHIQRLSAIYITIILSTVIGVSGILSQISSQGIELRTSSVSLQEFSKQTVLGISFTSDIIGLLAAYVLITVFFYSISAIFMGFSGGNKLFECTKAKTLQPVKHLHSRNFSSQTDRNFVGKKKLEWIKYNAQITEKTILKHKNAKRLMLVSIILSLLCFIGFLGIFLPSVENLISFTLTALSVIILPPIWIKNSLFNKQKIRCKMMSIYNLLIEPWNLFSSIFLLLGLHYHVRSIIELISYIL